MRMQPGIEHPGFWTSMRSASSASASCTEYQAAGAPHHYFVMKSAKASSVLPVQDSRLPKGMQWFTPHISLHGQQLLCTALLQEMAEAFQDAQQEGIAGRTTEDSEFELSSLRGASPAQPPSLQGTHTACHSTTPPCPRTLARAAAAALLQLHLLMQQLTILC